MHVYSSRQALSHLCVASPCIVVTSGVLRHACCRGRKDATPGPIYELPSSFHGRGSSKKKGYKAKGFTFPRSSDRMPPDVKKKIKDNEPGPGAYNLSFEHRVDAMMQEAQEYELMRTTGFGDDASSVGMTVNTMGSLGSKSFRSTASAATELGIKFGTIPTSPVAPSFSFGTGDRNGRKKVRGCTKIGRGGRRGLPPPHTPQCEQV